MPEHRPTVACVCLDFLKRDMLHVYRQVTGLQRYHPAVLTRKRENAALFPFEEKRIALLPKARTRFLRRLWVKSLRNRPVQIYRGEVKRMLYDVLRFDSEVVHVYFGHIAVHLLPFLRSCPRPLVVSFHGADAGVGTGDAFYRARMQEVLDQATLVLARSEALLDDLEALGCPREKLRLHRTGIPLEDWPVIPRKIPPERGAWRFLQACRLIEKKGLPTALDAFAQIHKTHPEATFTIAGDGSMKEELEKKVASLGLDSAVTFPGFLDPAALHEAVAQSHFFFHPSQTGADGNREGVPNAMLEAMASGVPPLATRHGGIPEAVEDGTSGLLVDEKDAAQLAKKALACMADPALYSALAAGARTAVENQFSQKAQSQMLEEFYDEAIQLHALRRQKTLARI